MIVNRVRLGLAILLLLLGMSLGTAWYVRRETTQLLEELYTMEALLEEQSMEEAAAAFSAFSAHWESAEQYLNLMVWRDKVMQMDITVSHLNPMRAENSDELSSELSEAKMWLERIGKSELPLLRNVF